MMPPNSARVGSNWASRAWPPSWPSRSCRCTSWPRWAATVAALRPAGPPPTTMILRGFGARGLFSNCNSRPVSGCWMQEIERPKLEVADAGLVAADAGADVIGPSISRLVGHFGIADHRPRHAAHIGGTFGQNLFGDLWLVDAACHEDCRSRRLLHLAREGRHIAMGVGHRRHDMGRTRSRGRGAGDHVEIVDIILQGAGDRQRSHPRSALRHRTRRRSCAGRR